MVVIFTEASLVSIFQILEGKILNEIIIFLFSFLYIVLCFCSANQINFITHIFKREDFAVITDNMTVDVSLCVMICHLRRFVIS